MREIAALAPRFGDVPRARVGLISLASDESCSDELRRLCAGPEIAIFETRIANSDTVSRESLLAMEAGLTDAAARLPGAAPYDAVAYLCTSASALIGPDRVAALVREGTEARRVIDPMSAALSAAGALGLRRIALVTPYVAEVTDWLAGRFEAGGVAVARAGSFFVESDHLVARLSPAAVREAVAAVAGGVDGVFVSCTAIRSVEHIAALEDAAGCPVLSSNLALGWEILRTVGQLPPPGRWGRLFADAPAVLGTAARAAALGQ